MVKEGEWENGRRKRWLKKNGVLQDGLESENLRQHWNEGTVDCDKTGDGSSQCGLGRRLPNEHYEQGSGDNKCQFMRINTI